MTLSPQKVKPFLANKRALGMASGHPDGAFGCFFMRGIVPPLGRWLGNLNLKDTTVKVLPKQLRSSVWSRTTVSNFAQLLCTTFWT